MASPHNPTDDVPSPRSPVEWSKDHIDSGMPTTEGDTDDEYSPNYVHPQARRLFAFAPFTRRIPILSEAANAYGPARVGAFGICYFLSKGVADYIITYAIQPLLVNRYGVDGLRYQRLSSISTLGWSIKALTATLCDAFAFLRYTKRWYMFLSTVLGGLLAIALGLLPAKESSANIACAFIFLSSFGKANVDILSEGMYSRMMRRQPRAGASLVSSIWWFIMVGSIIASGIQGPLSDSDMVTTGVFVSAAIQLLCAPIFFFNLYEERTNAAERWEDALSLEGEIRTEKGMDVSVALRRLRKQPPCTGMYNAKSREHTMEPSKQLQLDGQCGMPNGGALVEELPDDEQDDDLDSLRAAALTRLGNPAVCLFGVFEVNRSVITQNWKIFAYSTIMTCAVVASACGSILADTVGLIIICVVVSTVCCAGSFWALPLVIAKANVFAFLQMVFYIQLPGALTSFYLADEACVPGGPHFSYTFYNTVGSVIGNIGGLAGVSAFHYIFSKRGYRFTMMVTTAVQIIASIFDIIIVKRWNVAIGIPDHAMYICGDAIVYQVCYMLSFMPVVILLSRLCPRGSESVVYALLAGFSNLGQSLSSSVGAIMMEYGWTIVTEPPCDFSNVPMLVLVGHMIVPLLIIPLSLLLPSARVCDDINVDGDLVVRALKEEIMQDVDEQKGSGAVSGAVERD